MKARLPVLISVIGAVAAMGRAPACAAIAIFEDGRVAKIADYRVEGDSIVITLPGGGGYTTSIMRVERIVEDEVAPDPPASAPAVTLPEALAYDLTYHPSRKPLFQTPFDAAIDAECRKANLDAAMVSAVIKAESNYDPRARSRKGARGLMQLMPLTAARLGVTRSFDPVANIRGGVKYLKQLVARFSARPELVLAAYNAGEDAVESYGGIPPYRETKDYVSRILRWWRPSPKSSA
jgi:Transglycosylase SLT domain